MVNNLQRLCLKVWNSGMGLGGIATIIYGVLIFRAAGAETSSSHHINITIPWFFHAFLFVGIVLCAVSCLGHFAANTANTCCLSTYVGIILVLLLLETVMMTDAFFNPKWKKVITLMLALSNIHLPLVKHYLTCTLVHQNLPINQSDYFDDFMDSVVSSGYILKYLASTVFLVQAICVLLAALSIHDHTTDGVDGYESEYDDEDEESRVALLYSVARWQHSERYIV